MNTAKKIKDYILIAILILIPAVISYQNFNSGTYLSGWDTIHSEFDFNITFSRLLSPTYMDHQGLGAVSSQSHIAELPRIIFIYLLSFVASENFLRYSWIFLMLIIGPLGVYFFLKELLTQDAEDDEDESMLFPSFIGAIFYLTNLSVVQHFDVPLEMFVTFFGFLGFVFLFILKCQRDFSKKNFLYLVLFSFLISPSSHTATLFYMFLLFTGLYLLVQTLSSDNKLGALKNSAQILLTIFLTNLFWILPNIYFILTHGIEVSNSKIHTLFSDQAYLSNLSFGNLSDIAILKNYLFIWQIWNKDRFSPLLGSWVDNLNTGIALFGFAIFFFAIFGMGLSLVKKEKKLFGFIATFLFCAFFIASSKSVIGDVIDFLRNNVPFLQEALRFPFNKFSTLFSFSVSIFLAYFFYLVFNISKMKALNITTSFLFLVFSCVFFLPAFRGELINPLMRVNFDNAYFEMFDYFKNQPEYGRVADLPIHSVYGWSYYKFGYQGAGFLWFGIDKPLLNREFDRWGVKNEDYYNEMSFGIYNDNPKLVENVLNKYQVRWVLVDENIFSPGDDPKILHLGEAKKTLSQVPNLKLDKQIGENIYIYKFFPKVDFVKNKYIDKASFLSNESFRENEDLVFSTLGNYYSVKSSEVTFGLKTATEILNPKLISSDEKTITISNVAGVKANQVSAEIKLSFPSLDLKVGSIETNYKISNAASDYLSLNSTLLSTNRPQTLNLSQDNSITVWKKISEVGYPEIKNYISIINCGLDTQDTSYSLEQRGTSDLVINSQNADACVNFDLRGLLKNKTFDSYIVSFDVKASHNFPTFCSVNNNNCFKENVTETFQKLLSKDENILRLFNKSGKDIQSEIIVSNLKLTLIKNAGLMSVKLPEALFNKSDTLVIKKNFDFSGTLERFGFNPRVCGRSDSVKSELGVFESSDLNLCDSYNINYDANSYSIVEIKSKNYAGLPLRLCLQNTETYRCDFFVALPKNKELKSDFVLLPAFKGPHKLAITNQVIEGNVSKNEVSYMSINRIDYLNSFTLVKNNPNNLYYLDSSYDRGFIALCGYKVCNYEHVLVNNWANGWVLPSNYDAQEAPIRVFFWPNLLPVLGFFIWLTYILVSLWRSFNPPVVDKSK